MFAIGTTPRNRTRRTMALVAGLGMLTAAAACGDKSGLVSPTPVAVAVTALHDSTFAFPSLTTFAMPDTIIHFAPLNGTPLEVTRAYDQAVLNQIRTNLLARGYTEAAPGTLASFVVLVGATATTNYNAFIGYDPSAYWSSWDDYHLYVENDGGSWQIVYPWNSSISTTFDRGTLIVDVIPTLQVNPDPNTIMSVWAGVATSVMSDLNVTQSMVTEAIDQMFVLSPYFTAATVNPLNRAP